MEKKHYYTDEKNAQIVIALLKAHGIRRVIASPGSTHMNFLGSIQYDPYFQIWSAIDERHAAFMAVGMAAETGEPVVITCTGSSASRNYLPALTEAFYRKIPVLAITGSQVASHIGSLYSQAIDRSTPPKDSVKYSLACPMVYTDSQARDFEVAVNRALLELTRHGGGPVHLNLETTYDRGFSTRELPRVRKISRFTVEDELPPIPADAKIAVLIANHKPFTKKERDALETFLACRNAVAFCDVTSSWRGSKMIVPSLLCAQGMRGNPKYADLKPDLLIHIGEMCNDYPMLGYFSGIAPVWRANEDGEVRDRFGRLENVFEMPESFFFSHYATGRRDDSFCRVWKCADEELRQKFPALPFSNLWMAQQTLSRLPRGSFLHVGLSTTLQSWNACLKEGSVQTMSNVGTCGIDGVVSTLVGASVASPEKLFFGVVGDLTFFYDMNAIGNRHMGKNVRLLLVNNGTGGLFHVPGHIQEQFTDYMDPYMAAGGHFGSKSSELVKHYVTDLGFKYLSATDKESFAKVLPEFLAVNSDKPIVFECFVDVDDDRAAWGARASIDPPPVTLKGEIKKLIPQGVKNVIKGIIR